jgi:hypothetical protein
VGWARARLRAETLLSYARTASKLEGALADVEAPIVREVREGYAEELDSAAASLPMRRRRRHHVLRCDSFRVKALASAPSKDELVEELARANEGATDVRSGT